MTNKHQITFSMMQTSPRKTKMNQFLSKSRNAFIDFSVEVFVAILFCLSSKGTVVHLQRLSQCAFCLSQDYDALSSQIVWQGWLFHIIRHSNALKHPQKLLIKFSFVTLKRWWVDVWKRFNFLYVGWARGRFFPVFFWNKNKSKTATISDFRACSYVMDGKFCDKS